MANKDLRSIQFPGLPDTYVVPEQGGEAGKDGITPTIGANGNWYLGDTDTGKPSRGEKGETGAVDITAMSQSEYTAASAAGTLDEGKWYGVYPDA